MAMSDCRIWEMKIWGVHWIKLWKIEEKPVLIRGNELVSHMGCLSAQNMGGKSRKTLFGRFWGCLSAQNAVKQIEMVMESMNWIGFLGTIYGGNRYLLHPLPGMWPPR